MTLKHARPSDTVTGPRQLSLADAGIIDRDAVATFRDAANYHLSRAGHSTCSHDTGEMHNKHRGLNEHRATEAFDVSTGAALSTASQIPEQVLAHEAEQLAQSTATLAARAYADNTHRAYTRDFQRFCRWCSRRGYRPLPSSTSVLGMYLTSLVQQGKSVATLKRALTSISKAHEWAGYPSSYLDPEIRTLMRGIKRELGDRQTRKAPLHPNDLRLLISKIEEPDSLQGTRDRALLLLGFAGGLCRSDLVALDFEDISEAEGQGLCLYIARGNTGLEGGQGREIGIPFGEDPETCPVRALKRWLAVSGICSGAVFVSIIGGRENRKRLHGKDVARRVKRYATLAGLDAHKLAAHSLRSGLIIAAARAGKTERDIMRQTGHKSVVALRGYIQRANLFANNAAAGIGL